MTERLQQTDMETAMVRATLSAPRVLQDIGRISAAQSARSAGRARMHARCTQAARTHLWRRDRNSHVLPPGRVAAGRQSVGCCHPRREGGPARLDSDCTVRCPVVVSSDSDPRALISYRHLAIAPLAHAARGDLIGIGGCITKRTAHVRRTTVYARCNTLVTQDRRAGGCIESRHERLYHQDGETKKLAQEMVHVKW